MEIAAELNAENIRLFSFYIPASADPDVYFDQVIQRLSWMAGIAEGSGITLCHENEKEIYGDIASRCLKIHQALPSFRGVFDPANFIQCGQDAAEAWTMLKGYVKYLHIKDALRDGTVVPAGEGEGQLHRIVADFIRMGGGDMTIEPHLVSFEGLSDLQRDQHKRRTDVHIYQDNNQAFDAACNALRNLLC
jgi:sugar phosphate isomerase/epimerase